MMLDFLVEALLINNFENVQIESSRALSSVGNIRAPFVNSFASFVLLSLLYCLFVLLDIVSRVVRINRTHTHRTYRT
jgi:hypothetical protein